jgi:hypothetical protein
MIPSNNTLETITWARMEDRASEAEQRRIVRLASQAAARSERAQATQRSTLGWLRELATHLTRAGA